jgi:predicted metalloprotease with PDZ domain
VRRLRPSPLNKLQTHLSSGCFTDGLWLAEGFTRYYEFLLCTRIGTYSPDQFFSNVVGYWRHLTEQPAFKRVSATDSSLAAYLNHKKYPGRINTSIDYYDKGMLIAFQIDARLRLENGNYSLDRVLAEFYNLKVTQHRKPAGYTTAEFIKFLGDVHSGMDELAEKLIEHSGADETASVMNELGFEIKCKPTFRLGLAFKDGNLSVVSDVLDDGPAAECGISPGDIINRINGFQFTPAALRWAAAQSLPVGVEVFRGHRALSFLVKPVEILQINTMAWKGGRSDAKRIAKWLHRKEFAPQRHREFALDFYENFHGIDSIL